MVNLKLKTKFSFIFLILIIITFPINYNFGFGVRFVDIIVIIFIFWSLLTNRIKKPTSTFVLFYIFLILYLLSMAYGITFIGIKSNSNFLFIYKYILPFLLTYSLIMINLDEKLIKYLINLFFLIFFLLVIYTYFYVFFLSNSLSLSNFRPSFPFSNDLEWGVDAHLFSAYLSNSSIAFLFYSRTISKINSFIRIILIGFTFGALILTGSRTGIATVGLILIFFLIVKFFKFLRGNFITYRKIFIILIISLLIPLSFLNLDITSLNNHNVENIINRSLNFNFDEDESSLSRLNKTKIGLNLVNEELVIIGIGMQSTNMVWFDNSIANIVVSSGYCGLIVFLLIIFSFLYNTFKIAKRHARLKEFGLFFVIFIHYLLVNLITEYFLVTRCVVPFIIFISLVIKIILVPKVEVSHTLQN